RSPDDGGPMRQAIQSHRGRDGNGLMPTPTVSPTRRETTRNDTQHPETGSPLFVGDVSMILIGQFT
ncbi:MAG: hypothetical protein WBB42_03480, partial [Polyangiales bacterium]